MKIHDVEQGSDAWNALRLGLPTASMFHKILTPKTRKLSAQARGYAHFIIAEKLLNMSLNPLENIEWVQRGKEMEAQAVAMYSFERDLETKPVGFITNDNGKIGASPDRLLIGVNGAVEIKCPSPQVHIGYVVDGFGEDYIAQVQGQMLVGEFEFVDRYSFAPELPCPTFVHRTYRDDRFIADLRNALDQFLDLRDEMLEKLRAAGWEGNVNQRVEPQKQEPEREYRSDFEPNAADIPRESDEKPAKLAEKSPEPDDGPDDCQLVMDDIKADIDKAQAITEIKAILTSRRFAELKAARREKGNFLQERAQARVSVLVQRGSR